MRRASLVALLCGVASLAVTGCHIFDDLLPRHDPIGAQVAWHVAGRAIGTPAFDGATAYFNSGSHEIVALDGSSGTVRWRTPTGSTDGPPVAPSCVISGLFVVCGDEDVAAFRRDDGTLAWRYHATRGYSPGHFPIIEHSGVIYAGSHGFGALGTGTMYAIDASSGSARWVAAPLAADTEGVNVPSVSADDDIVIGAFIRGTRPQTGGVVALDAHTGAVRWIANFPQAAPDSSSGGISSALWSSSVVASSEDGKIYVLDRGTGAIQHVFPGVGRQADINGINTPVGQDLRAITISGSTLYAASFGNWLVAYDLVQLRELWRAAAPAGSLTNPIVADGDAVYAISFGGRIETFSATHPKLLWEYQTPLQDAFVGAVATSPQRLFVSGVTGMWALDKP